MPDRIFRLSEVERGSRPHTLDVVWEDGARAEVDISGYVDRYKSFASLRGDGWNDHEPKVGNHGWAVEWIPDEVEITTDTLRDLWMFATGQAMNPADFADWMDGHGLSLTAAAKALGISRRMVAYYKSGERLIPRYILLACKGYDVEERAAQNGMSRRRLHKSPRVPYPRTKGERPRHGRHRLPGISRFAK